MDEEQEAHGWDRRAREAAYEEGRYRERIDGQLRNHEMRLNTINGSIERAAANTRDLRHSIDKLARNIDQLHTTQQTRDAVAQALAKTVERAHQNQITTRSFAIGVATIVVALTGVILTHLA